ncbi:MAG TPA: hypothetical protein VM890_15750 [Longimicrobium sp.]|jgi:hypothetical protein|nr:hypothetical protein [Longimicrobium sp.]
MDLGLFSQLSSPSIPSATTLVRTSGYSSPAKGQAQYVYDSTLVSSYVTANPRTAFTDASGRVFTLADNERTPYMFGAVGDGATDDSAALQAFFDDAFPTANARRNYYNLDGIWAVSQPIYAAYPNGSGTPNEVTRRFRGGRLIVLPVSAQPGGVAMTNALTIVGSRQVWDGELAVQDGSGTTTSYATRRFYNAIRMMAVGRSCFEVIRVDGARWDALHLDSTYNGGATWTLRAGTPYEVSYSSRNNIGLQIGAVEARGCGSCHLSAGRGYSVAITGIDAGGSPNSLDQFNTTEASYANSFSQRSRLTVSSTSEFRVYDIGKVRLELLPADFGTVAADNAASTLTWSTGDPVAAGLQAGEKVIPQSGANSGKEFTVLGFGGTSNRAISVYPAPSAEAATAISGLHSGWSFHQIRNIPDGTHIDVYPWVPTRTNSAWYSMHGWIANVQGIDSANLHFDYLGGLIVGGGLLSGGLYGTHVSTLLLDYAEIGLMQGVIPTSANIGTVVDHLHVEATTVGFLKVTAYPGSHCIIKGGSSLDLGNVTALHVRTSPSNALPGPWALEACTIDRGGEILQSNAGRSYSGDNYIQGSRALTNHPASRQRTVIANSGTAHLDFNDDMARLFGEHHWAELFWIGPAGAAPTGTLNFALHANLAAQGWSIGGPASVTAPAQPCAFKVRFYKEGKKVLIARFDAA